MAAQSCTHELYPDTTITLALFRDVENAGQVKQAVIGGQLDACLLKASLVMDEFLVTLAANKAVHAERHGKMITRTVHNEILFNLASGRKISDAFKKFGMSHEDTAILFACVGDKDKAEQSLQKLQALIKGRQVSLDELPSLADEEAIRREYKLSDVELSSCSCVGAVASRIAAKGIVSV